MYFEMHRSNNCWDSMFVSDRESDPQFAFWQGTKINQQKSRKSGVLKLFCQRP